MKRALLLLFFPLMSFVISGQRPDSLIVSDTLVSQSLEEVVISAKRSVSSGIKTPEAIKILDISSVREHQIRTAPEALMLTPGIFVQKTNHGGGSPFIRGLTGNQTLLMIDGIRLSNSTMRYGPNQYFNTIDVFSIEKMEVLRGNGSVQYGSDALGGTIQAFSHELVTSENSDFGAGVISRFATAGMEKSLRAAADYSGKNAAFRAGVTWRDFGDLVGGDTTGRQDPSGYREFDYDIKAKIKMGRSSSLTMLVQSVRQSDVHVYHKVTLEDYAVNKTDPQKRKLAYLKFNRKINMGIIRDITLTGSLHNSAEGRESSKNGSDIIRYEKDKVRSAGFSTEIVTAEGNIWSASSGIDIYNDIVNSSRIDFNKSDNRQTSKRGLYPDGASMTSLAAFSIHTFDLPGWIITAGARVNTYIIKAEDINTGTTKITPSTVVGNLAILKKLATSSNLFLSLNSGFRAPNIDDLGTLGIVDFRYETPNFDLKPEHSLQYQLGYKLRNSRLRGDIYIYRNELYNLIVRNRVPDQSIEGYPLYMKENSERAYIQGIETGWDFSLNGSWALSGTLTYTYGENISRNEPVRRIPPLFGRLALDYENDNILIDFEWLAAGKQERLAQGDIDDNRIPDGGTPAWNIFNINAGYSFSYFRLDLSLNNLLNKDYRYHGSGVNGIGRSAFLTVSFYL